MAFLVGLFAFFVAFLAFVALWLVSMATYRFGTPDLPEARAERDALDAAIARQAQALYVLGRRVAALETEQRRLRPRVEVLPPAERMIEAERAYRRATAEQSMRRHRHSG